MAKRKNIILLQLGIAAMATSSLIGVVSCSEKNKTNTTTEKNLIELIKTEFEAREFGFENQTAQEIKNKNIINQGWIYSNKDKIFKESNFNQDDIKNLNIEIKNNYNLLISFEIKNNPYNFRIINFKIEQSNDEIEKYKQLIKEIKEVIKLKKTKRDYFEFDYNQITTDNFLNLDYEIQKKFIDFNWDELNEKFKNNALWIEEKGNKVKINYTCKKNQENQRQIDFQVEIIVGTERETILINQFSDFLDPNENKIENPKQYEELANEIAKVINLVPTTNSNYDHQQITVEEYVNKIDEQQNYFNFNWDELETKFPQNVLDKNTLLEFEISPNFEFDINNPKSLKFDIYIIVSNEIDRENALLKNIQSVKKVEKTIDTFKEPFETISGLDKEEIKDLITPQGATSYKGKLERFRMQDIKISSENNYIDLNRKMTWNDFKKEMMYQVRFALYQMFSDNFSEINYYTHNERENRSLTATAVGIIKEKRNDVLFYFQYLGSNSEHKQKTNVETGDRIEISITYSGNGENDWKPTMVSTSEEIIDLVLNWWSFKNSCDNLNDPNDPLYLNKPFLSFFPPAQFVIKKNDKVLYNETNNQYVIYSFIWKRKRS
ncbi:MAG: hypothetical protein IKF44_00495 [Mycoplasmataceae bacterium]|nr:hypothetical protein [Mycoplasmataceae bacterium]